MLKSFACLTKRRTENNPIRILYICLCSVCEWFTRVTVGDLLFLSKNASKINSITLNQIMLNKQHYCAATIQRSPSHDQQQITGKRDETRAVFPSMCEPTNIMLLLTILYTSLCQINVKFNVKFNISVIIHLVVRNGSRRAYFIT